MFSDDRELIEAYIDLRFTEIMSQELKASYLILDSFAYRDLDEKMIDIIHSHDEEELDVTQKDILDAFHGALNKLLEAHMVKLAVDTPLPVKNQLLSILYRLQRLEDPVPVLRILETLLTNEEKLVRIAEMYSSLRETDLMEYLEEVDDILLNRIMDLLYQQEKEMEDDYIPDRELNEMLRDFFQHVSRDNVAYELIENEVTTGLSVKIYYPYVKDRLITQDDRQTAINILSLFLMSGDTYRDPLGIYRRYGGDLIDSKDRIMKIEVIMGDILTEFHQYRGAKDVARSVSVVQHTA